jgi:hypothetical protein
MQITRQYILILSLWMLAMLSACDHSSPGSNQVTITPSNNNRPVTTDKAIQPGMDKSPMDMAYFPVEYPKLKMSGNVKEPPVARVIYSRPQKDNRVIFGDLVKYGSIWRLGANEATELEFFKDVTINDRKVLKGRYVLYCIPEEKIWKLVLNNDLYTWGLKIDTTKDAYEFSIPIEKTRFPYEAFTMEFEKADDPYMRLVLGWDSIKAALPIKY